MSNPAQVTETTGSTNHVQLGVIPEDVRGRIATCHPTTQAAFDKLVSYMAEMAPKKPVTSETGARWQVQLYSVLITLINKIPAEDFEPAFTVLLRTFLVNKDAVFHEKYVYRFMESIPLTNEDDRHAFTYLLHLVKVVADPRGREVALRQVDLNKALKFGVTEVGRQRVFAYLGR